MAQESWQVTGSAAQNYEEHVASWFAPWALDLVDRVVLRPDARVLEIACGTGVVTRALAEALGSRGSIVATDLNEGMLAQARSRPPTGAEVEWSIADAMNLQFGDDSFDAVFCQQGLQFVPDKLAAVSEMRRVLRPGGTAAVSVWGSLAANPYIAGMADGLTATLSAAAGDVMRAPCGLGDRTTFEGLFGAAGFSDVVVETVVIDRAPISARDAIDGNLSSLPMAGQIAAMEPADHDALLADILGRLSDFVTDGVLEVSPCSHIAIAKA